MVIQLFSLLNEYLCTLELFLQLHTLTVIEQPS